MANNPTNRKAVTAQWERNKAGRKVKKQSFQFDRAAELAAINAFPQDKIKVLPAVEAEHEQGKYGSKRPTPMVNWR
jgi:hypothetical protein